VKKCYNIEIVTFPYNVENIRVKINKRLKLSDEEINKIEPIQVGDELIEDLFDISAKEFDEMFLKQ
jgi:hypothetical protein